jgi:hypothetical protein
VESGRLFRNISDSQQFTALSRIRSLTPCEAFFFGGLVLERLVYAKKAARSLSLRAAIHQPILQPPAT